MNENNFIKSLTTVLLKKNNPCAIVDKKLEAIWSNNKDLINEAVKFIVENEPKVFLSDSEIVTNARIKEELFPVSIIPCSKPVASEVKKAGVFNRIPKDVADNPEYFIIEVYTDGSLSELMKNAELYTEKMLNSLNIIYAHLSNIPNAAEHFKEIFKGDEKEFEACERLSVHSAEALIQVVRLCYLLQAELVSEKINVTDMLDFVIEQAKQKINDGKKRLLYQRDDKCGTIILSSKRFAFAIMELISNAVYYSPKETPVEIVLRRVDDGAQILIRNNCLEHDKLPYVELKARLGLSLAESVFSSKKGRVNFEINDGIANTTITLPSTPENNRFILSSTFRDYATNKTQPIDLIFEKINRLEDKKT